MDIELLLATSNNAWTIISSMIAAASLLIKFLPELPEDHWAKPILKFLGKNVALNRTSEGKVSIKIRQD